MSPELTGFKMAVDSRLTLTPTFKFLHHYHHHHLYHYHHCHVYYHHHHLHHHHHHHDHHHHHQSTHNPTLYPTHWMCRLRFARSVTNWWRVDGGHQLVEIGTKLAIVTNWWRVSRQLVCLHQPLVPWWCLLVVMVVERYKQNCGRNNFCTSLAEIPRSNVSKGAQPLMYRWRRRSTSINNCSSQRL